MNSPLAIFHSYSRREQAWRAEKSPVLSLSRSMPGKLEGRSRRAFLSRLSVMPLARSDFASDWAKASIPMSAQTERAQSRRLG